LYYAAAVFENMAFTYENKNSIDNYFPSLSLILFSLQTKPF